MKKLLLLYTAGAFLTKLALWNTNVNDAELLLKWPFLWLNQPEEMLRALGNRTTQLVNGGNDWTALNMGNLSQGDVYQLGQPQCRCLD